MQKLRRLAGMESCSSSVFSSGSEAFGSSDVPNSRQERNPLRGSRTDKKTSEEKVQFV